MSHVLRSLNVLRRSLLRVLPRVLRLRSARDEASRGPTRRPGPSVVLALGIAVVLAVTGCTAGTAGGGTPEGGTGNGTGAAGGGKNSNAYLSYSPCCSWGTTWSFNPYNVNGLGILNNFVLMPLAIPKYPSLTEFIPQLADSWQSTADKITVHLRPAARWEDGTPVTSKDVYNTAILDATRGDGFWNDITAIDTPDDHTVVYTLRTGQPVALAENDILGMVTYPASEFGSFVTPQLEKDVFTYWKTNQQDPAKAAKLKEFKRMSAVFKKLAAHKVDKVIGNGPFRLENITTKEAKLPKSDTFWGKDKIRIGGIDYTNGDTTVIYPQMFSGRTDLSNVYMPPPILKRWQSTPDAKTALPLAFGFAMGFNNHRYPLNIKEVRQALAYVIPREQISKAAYGTVAGAGGTWKEVSTGISPSLEKLYLPQDKIDRLNKYPVDPAKAAQLLRSKGFTKKGDTWLTPKGKPFTLTFIVNSATTDIVTSFNSAAKALTAFGITSDVNATSGAQQDADQHKGDFDIGMYFIGGNNPLAMYDAMLGPGNNFSTSGNYADTRGIGFGPTMEVPGLGKVDVPKTIDAQTRSVAPGPRMNELVWDWAQLVNDQVPYIWYATKVYQFPFSTKRFTNWPPMDDNGTSPLWDIIGANLSGGVSLALQQGYIVPT